MHPSTPHFNSSGEFKRSNFYINKSYSPYAKTQLNFTSSPHTTHYEESLTVLERKLLQEQDARLRSEQEQARLLMTVRDLERQLESLKMDFDQRVQEGIRAGLGRLEEQQSQLQALQDKVRRMEEIKAMTTQQMSKFKAQAESVIRAFEIKLAEEEQARKKAEDNIAKAITAAQTKLASKQLMLDAMETRLKEEMTQRDQLQADFNKLKAEHERLSISATSMERQIAESRQREEELLDKIQTLTRKLEESTTSTHAVRAGQTESTTVQKQLERITLEASIREQELLLRLQEQNQLISILRQALAGESVDVGSLSMNAPQAGKVDESIEKAQMQSTIATLSREVEQLKMKLAEATKAVKEESKETGSPTKPETDFEEVKRLRLELAAALERAQRAEAEVRKLEDEKRASELYQMELLEKAEADYLTIKSLRETISRLERREESESGRKT